MKIFAARKARRGFRRLLRIAQQEPVMICGRERTVAILLSVDAYERLQTFDDGQMVELSTRDDRPTSMAIGSRE